LQLEGCEGDWCFTSTQCEAGFQGEHMTDEYIWRYCDPATDNRDLWRLLKSGPTPKIASSQKLNATLLIDLHDEEDPRIVMCKSATGTCRPILSCPPTRTSWTPTAIMVDDTNDLVLVGDSKNLEIHAFDFEGTVIHSISSPKATTALASRPGAFVPLTDVALTTASPTTTSPIIFMATGFSDRFGEPATADVDFSNFAIKATGDVSASESNVVLTKTITGAVSRGEEGEVNFIVDVSKAGEWTFSLVDVFNEEFVRERSARKRCGLLPTAAANHRCLKKCRCFHSRY
jgi:hypothetical protein